MFEFGSRAWRLRMALLMVVAVICAGEAALAATEVSGHIADDATWSGVGSPYVVIGSVTVDTGVTLAIEAGVVVKADTGKSICVRGQLDCEGTSENPVVFTSLKDDTCGGDTNNDGAASAPAPGDWHGIEFQDSSTNTQMTNSLIRYGVSGVTLRGVDLCIRDNTFEYCCHPLEVWNSFPTFMENQLVENEINGIRLHEFSRSGALKVNEVELPYVSLETWMWNYFKVAEGTTVTLPAGCVIKSDDRILVQGELDCQGTADNPVVFTSLKDDSHGGDTNNDGGASAPAPGDWNGIGFDDTSTNAEISNCLIRCASWGVGLFGADLDIHHNTFERCQFPAALEDAFPAFRDNVLVDNEVDGINLIGFSRSGTLQVTDVELPYVDGSGWMWRPLVESGATVRLPAGCVVKCAESVFHKRMRVAGKLECQGTSQNPVVFTSLKDDSYCGDTNNDGDATTPTRGDWPGIHFLGSSTNADISNCLIRYADAGIVLSDVDVEVHHNTFDHCCYPLRLNGSFPAFRENQLIDNEVNGVQLSQFTRSGTLGVSEVQLPYVASWWDGFEVGSAATVTLPAGCLVKSDGMIDVRGNIDCQGTAGNPVVFTSLKDDSHGGDTNNDGGASAPAAGDWDGIQFHDSSTTGELAHCIVRYAANGIDCQCPGLSVQHCVFDACATAFRADAANIQVHWSDFFLSGDYALHNAEPAQVVDATNCYWDSPSGPTHASNPGATGGRITDGVEYDPWGGTPYNGWPQGHSVVLDGPWGDPNPVACGGQVQCSLTAEDSHGHDLTCQWSAEDAQGNPAGEFDDATKQEPVWMAPAVTEATTYTLTVTVTCSEGAQASGSFEVEVQPFDLHFGAEGIKVENEPYEDRPTTSADIRLSASVRGPEVADTLGAVTVRVTVTDGEGHSVLDTPKDVECIDWGTAEWQAFWWATVPTDLRQFEGLLKLEILVNDQDEANNILEERFEFVVPPDDFEYGIHNYKFSNDFAFEPEHIPWMVDEFLRDQTDEGPIRLLLYGPVEWAAHYFFIDAGWLGGHCYGMSATAIKYLQLPDLIPEGEACTHDLSKQQAYPNIGRESSSALAEALLCMVTNVTGLPFSSWHDEAKGLLSTGPVIVAARDGDPANGWRARHAVVAHSYVRIGETAYLLCYNNQDYDPTRGKVWQEFCRGGGSWTAYRPQCTVTVPDFRLDEIVPRWISVLLDWVREQLSGSNSGIVTVGSPVDTYVEDEAGRRTGVVNGTVVTEIPDAQFSPLGEKALFQLPATATYTIHHSGTGDGTLEQSTMWPTGANQVTTTVHTDVRVSSATKCQMRLAADSDFKLAIDQDGDGTPEHERDPNIVTDDATGHAVALLELPHGDVNPVRSGGSTRVLVTAEDTQGHPLAYQWTADDTEGNPAGSFDNGTTQSPTWTAPSNISDEVHEYTITLTVTCGEDPGTGATASYIQRVTPVDHEMTITEEPAGDPNPAASGEEVICTVTAEDSREGHTLTYQWTAEDAEGNPVGGFNDASAQNAHWTAPEVGVPTDYTVSVTAACAENPNVSATDSFVQHVLPVVNHSFATGLRMVGVPIEPNSSGSMEELLGAEAVARWDAEAQAYITVTSPSDICELGEGCWARFGSQQDVEVAGTPYTNDVLRQDVKPNWNLVALPWNENLPISAMSSQPVGGILAHAWTYYGGDYHLVAPIEGIPGILTEFEPWRGYWVYANSECDLILDREATSSSVETMSVGDKSREDVWVIRVVASACGTTDSANYCGISPRGDALDIPNPPTAWGGVDLYFTSQTGAHKALDFCAARLGGTYEWNFEVVAPATDQQVAVACPDLSSVPNDYRVYLVDRDAQKTVYMRTTSSYQYAASSEAPRHFASGGRGRPAPYGEPSSSSAGQLHNCCHKLCSLRWSQRDCRGLQHRGEAGAPHR